MRIQRCDAKHKYYLFVIYCYALFIVLLYIKVTVYVALKNLFLRFFHEQSTILLFIQPRKLLAAFRLTSINEIRT